MLWMIDAGGLKESTCIRYFVFRSMPLRESMG